MVSPDCKRIHFFSIDMSPLLTWPLTTAGLSKFHADAGRAYCGFCVVRPLPTAPIGRTVLTARVSDGQGLPAPDAPAKVALEKIVWSMAGK